MNDEARFWAKVNKTSDCWLWTASHDSKGYGMFRLAGRSRRAHTVAYEWAAGPVPRGLMLDHLCRVPACVRPDHLEAVTNRENVMRGLTPLRRLAIVCRRGHALVGDNVGLDHRGDRFCRTCQTAAVKRWQEAHPDRMRAACKRFRDRRRAAVA